MEILEQKIKLTDSCALIGKAKDIFAPLKEAITNSLDAIYQRQKLKMTFVPSISVSVHFKTSKDLFGEETCTLAYISVEDNGIGFTTENLARFKTLAENSKNMNNRGTGKIQIFCRFNQVSIESAFQEAGKWYNLNVEWRITGEYKDILKEASSQVGFKTIIKMSGFSGDEKEQDFFHKYFDNSDEIKKDILKRFLLRLWLGVTKDKLTLTVKTFVNKNIRGEFTFNEFNIPSPDKVEKIYIDTEQAKIISEKNEKMKIEWASSEPKSELSITRFKLANTDMDSNSIYLCSKNIVVEPFNFPIVRKNASFNGFRYLTSVSGELFDNPMNIKQAVDGFMFPSKKKIEVEIKEDSISLFNQERKFVFWEEIKNKISQGLSKVYLDIEELKEEQENNIAVLAKQYGISLADAEESNIQLNDTEEEATEKLFETQAKRFAKQSIEIQQTYNELKKLKAQNLNPSSEQYRTKLGELSSQLLEKIPLQNKDELARYIIRRDMVVDLLRLALNNALLVQKEWAKRKAEGEKIRQDNEGIIHDIIFKRRMKGVSNDLWILNEEFVHFEGCSDVELEKLEINNEKFLQDDTDIDEALKNVGIEKQTYLKQRPDIFLFPEEGKCILVEFKAPDAEVTRQCDQMQKYARLIANYARKPIVQFYGLLIGEQIDRVSVPGRYIKVPYGNYWFYPDEPIRSIDEAETIKAHIYQEIMPLSEIAKRAEIRNRSFAEKLGITPNDISEARKMENEHL